jgi:hypothetical protein
MSLFIATAQARNSVLPEQPTPLDVLFFLWTLWTNQNPSCPFKDKSYRKNAFRSLKTPRAR